MPVRRPPLPLLEGRWCARRLAEKGALTSARHHELHSRLAISVGVESVGGIGASAVGS